MKNQKSTPKEKNKGKFDYQKKAVSKPDEKVKTSFVSGNNASIAIFIISFLLYVNTLSFNYALDDRLMITDNAFTKKGVAGIPDILTTDSFVGFFGKQKNLVAGGRYRPLSQVTFALEYELYGLKPFLSHLINVILYSLACVLVYKVLLLLFANRQHRKWFITIPFIATALFAAHPLHTEVVANIKGRDEIMSLLGSFGALYFVLKYIQSLKIPFLIWSGLSFFLALLSKENAITFIIVIPVTLYFFTKTTFRNGLIATTPLIIFSLVFILIRYKVLGFFIGDKIETELLNDPFINAGTAQKFATILLTWGKYLLLLFFPHPLTHDYYPKQIPIIEMNDLRALLPLLIYLSMIIYVIILIRKKDVIAYGILIFGITFSISSNVFFSIGTFMNERFMFIPLLGFTIIAAYLLSEKLPLLFRSVNNKIVILIAMGVILIGYSVKTIARNPVWKDDYTLFTTDVKVSCNSAKCNVSAGGMTLEKAEKESDPEKRNQMINDAVKFLIKGIELHPKNIAPWLLMGKAMIDIENYAKSREYLEGALKLSPGNKDAINNWLYGAQMSVKKKDYKDALDAYSKLTPYDQGNLEIQMNIAAVYEDMRQYDSVVNIMNRIIAKNDKYAPAYAKLGEIYGKVFNKIDISLENLLKAYTISPGDASNLENMGIAYGITGDYNKSIEFFSKSIAIKPDKPEIYLNMRGTYLKMGRQDKAEECLRKATELRKTKN